MSPELRIIGGKWHNHKISSMGGGYRPTQAKIKKSLFDILGPNIIDTTFLDLFAGTGAVGLEALSRGAGQVAFIEESLPRVNILKANLKKLRVDDIAYEIMWEDYLKALDQLRNRKADFDYIFVDPPYHDTLVQRILGDIAAAGILAKDGLIIFETARKGVRELLDSVPVELYPMREVGHGGTALLFFRWRRDDPDDTAI